MRASNLSKLLDSLEKDSVSMFKSMKVKGKKKRSKKKRSKKRTRKQLTRKAKKKVNYKY
jgi:hypothetical protein